MMAINDDYYEDLTPEATIELVEKLKNNETITPGPVSGRASCEPLAGKKTLTSKPYGPGDYVRSDL